MSAPKGKDTAKQSWQLTGPWAGAWKIFAILGVLGLLGAGYGYTVDPRRFAFSWLFAFITVLVICLGCIFFILIQHLTSAGWSVTVRRTAEFFALGMIALVPLFVPVLISMNHLFPWLEGHEHGGGHPESGVEVGQHKVGQTQGLSLIKPAYAQAPADPHAAPAAQPPPAGDHAAAPPAGEAHGRAPAAPGGHGAGSAMADTPGHAGGGGHGAHGDPHALIEKEILAKKAPYLNKTFFLIRAGIYFFIWIILATRFFGWSTAQDKSKDPKLTLMQQRWAPPSTLLFGLSLTFAAFDWIMSLEPTWFSTIFGVTIFASGVVSSLAVIILTTLALRASGPLEGAVTIEHYHDLGKLMFGFLVFWAYVNFSQFMLIWYAALPEETTFFHNRWDWEPWANVSMGMLFFQFVVPFFWTISRTFKRNVGRLQIGAAINLVMHVVNMYWLVMPNYHLGKAGFQFHWLDAACLLAVGGFYCAFVFNRMTQQSLVPVGDPRLQRALQFMNA